MATATKTLVTADEFERMTLTARAELIDGEVMTRTSPGPRHGAVCINVVQRLLDWSPQWSKGVLLSNDARVRTSRDPDTVRGPDLMFLSKERIPAEGLTDRSLQVPPDLIVEVLSPSDRWRQVRRKLQDFLAMGAREVWVLDPKDRTCEIFRPDEATRVLTNGAELTTDVLPGFRCIVGDFFAGV